MSLKVPPSFGWAYFHFVEPGGTQINSVVHKTDIFGLESEPYMSMMIKDTIEVQRLKGLVNYDWDIRNMAGAFRFTFGRDSFEGKLTGLRKDNGLKNIALFREKKSGRASMWSVDVPYGKFEGKIDLAGRLRNISGYVYQDRQWGDLLLQEWVSDWVWGQYLNETNYSIFFKIAAKDGTIISHAMLGLGKTVTTTNNFEVSYMSQLVGSQAIDAYKFSGEVNFADVGIELSTILDPGAIMRARINEAHPGFFATYLRWSSDGRLGKLSAYGITEYMRIR